MEAETRKIIICQQCGSCRVKQPAWHYVNTNKLELDEHRSFKCAKCNKLEGGFVAIRCCGPEGGYRLGADSYTIHPTLKAAWRATKGWLRRTEPRRIRRLAIDIEACKREAMRQIREAADKAIQGIPGFVESVSTSSHKVGLSLARPVVSGAIASHIVAHQESESSWKMQEAFHQIYQENWATTDRAKAFVDSLTAHWINSNMGGSRG